LGSVTAVFVTLSVSCYYDNTPPTLSELNDSYPELRLSLSGFTPGAGLKLRIYTPKTRYTYPSEYTLYVNGNGGYAGVFYLPRGTTGFSFLLFIDTNNDGVVQAGEFFDYRLATIGTQSGFVEVAIPGSSAPVLTVYNSVAPLPASGQKVCIYDPVTESNWSSSVAANLPPFPQFDRPVTYLSDWFPVSVLLPGGISQNTALASGSWNEVCVGDLNSNNLFDAGETVTVSPVVVIP